MSDNQKKLDWLYNMRGGLAYKGEDGKASRDVYRLILDAPKDAAEAVMNHPVQWFGYDGKTPGAGRKTVTLAAVIGWLDTGLTSIMTGIRANGAKLDALSAKVDELCKKQGIDPEDLERIITKAVQDSAGQYELRRIE